MILVSFCKTHQVVSKYQNCDNNLGARVHLDSWSCAEAAEQIELVFLVFRIQATLARTILRYKGVLGLAKISLCDLYKLRWFSAFSSHARRQQQFDDISY